MSTSGISFINKTLQDKNEDIILEQLNTIEKNLISNHSKLIKTNKTKRFRLYNLIFLLIGIMSIFNFFIFTPSSQQLNIVKYHSPVVNVSKKVVIERVKNITTHVCKNKIIGFAHNNYTNKTSALCNFISMQGWTHNIDHESYDAQVCPMLTHLTSVDIKDNKLNITCSNTKELNKLYCEHSVYAVSVYIISNRIFVVPHCSNHASDISDIIMN